MRIEFLKPSYFILLPIIFAIIIFVSAKSNSFSNFSNFSNFKKYLLASVRLIVCMCLVVAMAVPRVNINSDIITTMVLVDKSASINDTENVDKFLKSLNENKGTKDEVGVIVFGENASVEQMPTLESGVLSTDFQSIIDDGNTNIDSALTISNSLFDKEKGKRIVLISDGIETIGDSITKVNMLNEQGVDFKIFEVENRNFDEVQITSLNIPNSIPKNLEYTIEMEIDSTFSTSANIRLYKNDVFMKEEEVYIESGKNRIVFTDYSDMGGAVFYKGEIVADGDTFIKNNTYYGYTFVEDIPEILIIGDENNGINAWESIVQNSNIKVSKSTPATAPTTIENMQRYQTIILSNVSAEDLPIGFLNSLESYVGVTGGGLIVSGGDKSFGLGAYGDTVLEDILPIDMEVKTQGEESNFAMIMVIDRSGSMSDGDFGISPLDMAKEAVISSLYGFKEKDLVGVLGFDDKFLWIVPVTEVVGNENEIINKVTAMNADGGTSILPALNEAVTTLKDVDAKEKHIILLTDGMAETTGYDTILNDMNNDGITLSTVAVGGGSDIALLKRLAESGSGRYYYTDAFVDLPKIFAKETLLASKEYVNEESFYPIQSGNSSIVNGIESFSELNGYVSTTAKQSANSELILMSDNDEPILATGQYGVGRTAVWTSDVGGSWSGNFLSNYNGLKVLQNTLGYVLNTQLLDDFEVDVTAEIIDSENSVVTLNMPNYDENIKSIKATILYDDGENITAEFDMITPTTYESYIPIAKDGVYIISLEVTMKNGDTVNKNTGFLLPYSNEYDINYKESILKDLIMFSGAEVVQNGDEVFGSDIANASMKKEITNTFLWLAMCMFLIDIGLRRFTFIVNKIENFVISKISYLKQKDGKGNKKETKEKIKEVEKSVKQEIKQETKQEVKQEIKQDETSTAQKLAGLKKKRDDK